MSTRSLTVCLTFDFDGMSSWIGSLKSRSLPALSRGEFGAHAIPRILQSLERLEVPATFFTPGHTALAFPRLVQAIVEDGHEIGHHGWIHENPAKLEPAAEKNALERGLVALEKVTGMAPRGYRAPECEFSELTVELLREYGFAYDSSCSASDFLPYYLRQNDLMSATEAYVFGETTNLVEVPFAWILDDFPLFEFVAGSIPGQTNPLDVRLLWQQEFDYALSHVPGGSFVLCMHPETIGRGARLSMLEGLVEYMKDQPGVGFERVGDYAQSWRASNPLSAWCAAHPDRVGAGSLPSP